MTVQAYTGSYPFAARTLDQIEPGDHVPVVIVATLPLPPSTNALFANVAKGRIKTKAYKAWLEEAGWHLKRAWSGLGRPQFAEQPMMLEIQVGLKDRSRDLSNCCKAIEDLLVKVLPVPDDRWNDRVLLERGDRTVPDGLCRVRLAPLNST